MQFIMDMVHHNPGEPPFDTSFLSPETLLSCGYRAQVHKGINCAVTCDCFDPTALPADTADRAWILEFQKKIQAQIRHCKQAGLQIYYHIDLLLLPRLLLEKHRDLLCDAQGIVSLDRSETRRLLRCMLDEIFTLFPQVDGLIVRVGETYLYDTPCHTGNSPIRANAYEGSEISRQEEQRRYVQLLTLLREEVCEKHQRYLFFRTWDCYPDKFHANAQYYLEVTNQIPPHPKLLFSIKHTAQDFWRWLPFNPCIGIGQHCQIVEIQCQREYEGKGAYPNYVGDGVLNGFPEQTSRLGLRQAAQNPLVRGIYTWSRGGGWYGPYVQNELWCRMHAWIFGHWAADPSQDEPTLFRNFCIQVLSMSPQDASVLRELCLTSSQALLEGRYCGIYEQQARLDGLSPSNWMRDDRIGGMKQLSSVLEYLQKTSQWEAAIAEKEHSVSLWQKTVKLSRQIHTGNEETRAYIITSCRYGLLLYTSILEQWKVYRLFFAGQLHTREGFQAVKRWEQAWKEYLTMQNAPQCASLYRDDYFHLPGTPEIPGAGLDLQTLLHQAQP